MSGNGTKPAGEPNDPGCHHPLRTLRSVKRELADVYRKLKSGEITDTKRANAMIYALNSLADVIKGADLEGKLSRFERRAKGDTEATTQ